MRVFAALALASLAAAQNVTVISVGGVAGTPALQYSPSSITAAVGDIVTFNFTGIPGNHTVTESAFASPCQPLSGGFDSGWIYIPAGTTGSTPTWNLTVTNSTKPIWFYCKQLQPTPHCVSGMVGAINAPTTGNTFAAFQAAAKASTGTPGQAEGALVGVGASASAAPGPFTGSITGFAVPSATSPSGSGTSASGTGTGTSSSSSSTSTPTGAAASVTVNIFGLILASVFGIALA